MVWEEALTPSRTCSTGENSEQPSDQVDEHAPAVAAATALVQYECRGAWVVAARGDYDLHSITPLAEALGSAARTHRKVVLDTSGVSFADSTFLNMLIRAHQETTLRVVAPTPQLRRILQVTGVDSVLDTRATVEEAAA